MPRSRESTPVAVTPPSTTLVPRHREEPGHTRPHETDIQEPHKPTSKPTPPTDSRARPHPNPGTHASPHTTPLTRKLGGGNGDGDGARTWEQRGREPDGIGDGTPPPRTGRRGVGTVLNRYVSKVLEICNSIVRFATRRYGGTCDRGSRETKTEKKTTPRGWLGRNDGDSRRREVS